MKLSDYVAGFVAQRGVRHLFMVTGGGAMHLNDSFGHEPRLQVIFNHHEQACAMAAEGYARVTNQPGVINVTTGPGGINAMNGVFGAWTDSIPLVVISGQVKRETCLGCRELPRLRQLGDQEADVIAMVQGITKYAVLVRDPASIRYHLERSWHLAVSGRPGPVWLDIPLDVQASPIDPATLASYDPREDAVADDTPRLPVLCQQVLERIRAAKRPVLMPGTGVRLANALEVYRRVAQKLAIPNCLTWTSADLLSSGDPLACGRAGTIGDRAGNFTAQNADLLLVLGSRLNIRQVSYNWGTFARAAYKIQVDADPAELTKPTVVPDLGICCDARAFLEELERQIDRTGADPARHADWLAWCRERTRRYPVVLERHRRLRADRINPYHFVEVLFDRLGPEAIVACGNGAACVVPFQAGRTREGQRLFANSGSASMGYDLPAAIGAAVAARGQPVVCLAGDGSLQMNIQELQTVAHYRLPIKIFVLNNGGYLSIRTTQKNFFRRLTGEGPASGLTFPDVVRLAEAYGLPAARVSGQEFPDGVARALEQPGPLVCEVMLDPEQEFEPKLSARALPDGRIVSPPLEDMYPFLERDELRDNMQIPILEESR